MRVTNADRIGRKTSRSRKRKSRRRTRWRSALRGSVIGAAAIVSVCVLLVLALRWLNPPFSAFMLQDDSPQARASHTWVAWRELGDHLPLAVVAAEDQKFLQHHGFDIAAIREAIQDNARGEGMRGASTISQQVAKNLFLWPGRTYLRKGLEAWFTVLIEMLWPKRRILEVYLNIAEFGKGAYGAGAAAQRLFGTTPARLDARQAALLAGVLPNPKQLRAASPSDYLRQRQQWIQTQMERLRRAGWLEQIEAAG